MTIISCDEFVKKFNVVPALMKIDVEGAELYVLRGAKALLREHHPAILLSIHSDDLRRDCLEYLREIGYSEIRPVNTDSMEDATEYAIVSTDRNSD